jgi:hypothetical protein
MSKCYDTESLIHELTTDNTQPRTAAQLLATVKTLLTKRKFTGNSPAVRRRQNTEETLVLAVAVALLDAGFQLGVYDGGEVTISYSRDIAAIQKALFTTDEDSLLVYKAGRTKDEIDSRPDYSVTCVYGNDGYDVISDYSGTEDLERCIGYNTAIAELQQQAEDGRI